MAFDRMKKKNTLVLTDYWDASKCPQSRIFIESGQTMILDIRRLAR